MAGIKKRISPFGTSLGEVINWDNKDSFSDIGNSNLPDVTIKGFKIPDKFSMSGMSAVTPRGNGISMRTDLTNPPPGPGIVPRIAQELKDVSPFLSNIRNSFIKPPKPKMGKMNDFVSLNRVNMDADRNAVSREVNANTTQAYRSLDANTAAAVGMQGLGTKLNQFSQISQQENNANTQIGNQEALVNAQIGQGNNATRDEYNTANIERDIAHKREQSANWANTGQKLTEIGNEREKGRVSQANTRVYAEAFKNSKVADQIRYDLWKKGESDPEGKNYEDLDKNGVKRLNIFASKKFGGIIPMKKLY